MARSWWDTRSRMNLDEAKIAERVMEEAAMTVSNTEKMPRPTATTCQRRSRPGCRPFDRSPPLTTFTGNGYAGLHLFGGSWFRR